MERVRLWRIAVGAAFIGLAVGVSGSMVSATGAAPPTMTLAPHLVVETDSGTATYSVFGSGLPAGMVLNVSTTACDHGTHQVVVGLDGRWNTNFSHGPGTCLPGIFHVKAIELTAPRLKFAQDLQIVASHGHSSIPMIEASPKVVRLTNDGGVAFSIILRGFPSGMEVDVGSARLCSVGVDLDLTADVNGRASTGAAATGCLPGTYGITAQEKTAPFTKVKTEIKFTAP